MNKPDQHLQSLFYLCCRLPSLSQKLKMSTHPPATSFMGIPSELRIAIFEYLLLSKDIKYDCMFTPSRSPYRKNTLVVFGEKTLKPSFYGGISTTIPMSRAWNSTHFAISRINRQCNIEASKALYNRTLSIKMDNDSDEYEDWYNIHAEDWYNLQPVSSMNPYENSENSREPHVWFWNSLWVPRFSALSTLELMISPRNTQGYWYTIRSSIALFLDHNLQKPPKNLIIKLFDMARSTYDPWIHSLTGRHPWMSWRAISATFEDYMETLQIFQHIAPRAENCQIFLPYWMEHKFQRTALKTVWAASPGMKVRFMPLGAWLNPTEYLGVFDKKMRLPKLAYQTPVSGVPQNERSWSALAWSPNKEAPRENFEESRVREGYFFLADLAKDAQ